MEEQKRTSLDYRELLVAKANEIIWVPVEKVQIWGRSLHPNQNQFTRYFSEGLESLDRFFNVHQPQNQFQAIFLPNLGEEDMMISDTYKYRKPWSYVSELTTTPEFGPVSRSLIRRETKRLDRIRSSVVKNGFFYLDSDFISFGSILVDDVSDDSFDYRCQVLGGIHRAALLAHLGWKMIPMVPAARTLTSARDVRLSQIKFWPGVLDETFSENNAKKFFRAHFRDPDEIVIPDW